ncbi:Flagellar motor protein MotB [Desulfuromusa kysingii]|uniref:Flagellar motor protein MotB n=1 Tax=Desulfuromusa kysingii TaxID=37625 RepID=A0A1H4DH42_9BACT|nr:OmpA family protein [Desulfuromusa kysingii]SEA71826.1 Flagellar motor protein MotB [Desulfuromusa kysingii]
MKNLTISALVIVLLGLGYSSAVAANYCQEDGSCSPCDGDGSCLSVNGKRIDSGASLGARHNPPANSERQLDESTWELSPYQQETVSQVEEVPVTINRTELKQVIDSSVAPKFGYGKSFLTPSLQADLKQLAAQLAGKQNLRLRIVGHTDPDRLSRKSAAIYGDNFGLGQARADATAEYLAALLNLEKEQIETSSRGPLEPIAPNDKGEGQARNRRVEIFVSYDDPVIVATDTTVTTTKETPVEQSPLRACSEVLSSRTAATAAPFRISIDGVPLADTGTIDPDIQRCTDVALEKADIQIHYDDLESTPWLNVSATPNSAVRQEKVTFTAYSNYDHWIQRREVRIFAPQDSTQSTPLQVLPITSPGQVEWFPGDQVPNDIRYVLRVYDEQGQFDETAPKALRIDHRAEPQKNQGSGPREELIGYGENSLQIHNIPVHGGAVTVNGSDLPPDSLVSVMGQRVPVAANGRFATRQILPAGPHVVTVEVENQQGQLNFARNLYVPDQDWFYIGIADLIAGENRTSGPASLVTTDDQHYENDLYIDGRLAFYLKGKIKGEWLLTAAADTQEQPFEHLFSNFDSKDPEYLLRRLDPDLYYPVYGDDSTTVEDAPTSGKFYVKVAKGDSHVMWGNFQTRWTGSDFANINRGMYGANAHWESPQQTSYGEKRAKVDLFAGDPGTLGARDEFRGTGGSLYYLRHLDITTGSDNVWVEIRDKDSGLVLETNQLTAGQDYEVNSLQGRLLLTSPLPSTADDSQLVRSGSLSGHPVYLVATYEYTPGVSEADNMTVGGRATAWGNDHLNIGVTGYKQGDDDTDQTLGEVDATLRYAAGTYVKAEVARSDGSGSGNNSSLTGGFEFETETAVDTEAMAKRVEAGIDFAEVSDQVGHAHVYWQDREEGFSGPGQIAAEDIEQLGAAISAEITDSFSVETRADMKEADTQDSVAASMTGIYQLNQRWSLSGGVRYDDLDNRVANSSSTLSENGSRTDLAGQVNYTPAATADHPDWSAYGFVQGTIKTTESRENNDRFGVGGRYKLFDPLQITGEVSGGDGGLGGLIGADWRVNERSQLYMNYTLDTDRTDDLSRGRQGQFTSGGKTRYTDSLSVYVEERLQHGDGPSGLIHSFGLDLAASDAWNFGFKAENGDLSDADIEDLERTAFSFSAGYAKEKTRYAGNLEWRKDDGTTSGKRTTWLMRNNVGYQTTEDWRFLGKLNFSFADSDQGDTYNADFVEAVLGYAYRPVANDKLNTLFKYTYFYDLPSSSALTSSETLADYAQKSHVFSIDAIYDLTPWISIGGKYGYRRSEIRENRVDGSWYSSNAHLGVVRTDLHFTHNWDALLEARLLKVTAAEDQRAGFLAAIYRHINKNIKFGVGYNFTDFSDDLTDLDYDSKGWFINLIGKL